MEYLKFIIYGIIQGLTEFIPVSSTAHLKIISSFLGIDDPGSSLSAIIQLGSVFAIIWYFRDDLFNLNNLKSKLYGNSFFRNKLSKSILIGTFPFIFFGGLIKVLIPDFFNTILRSNISIAITSLFMAIFMYIADISRNRFVNIKNHNYPDSLLIGFSQALAIVPGVSRSGITISTALLSGWERKDAAKYSFLLGIPAISLAAIVEFIFSLNIYSSLNIFPLLVGLTTTFLSSLFAIDFLIKYLNSFGLKLFVYYRLVFAILIFLNI